MNILNMSILATLCAMSLSGCMKILPAIAPGVESEPSISAEFPYESRYVQVLGSKMHYVERGEGDPILLLHGNPTSSYLWRNVIPHLSSQGRVIAVDLIGMGQSDKPNIEYQLEDHIAYIDGFIETLGLKNVVLVLHDWGGGIGFDYAMRNADNVRGIAFMEAVLRPSRWEDVNAVARYLFKNLRDEQTGYDLIVRENYFVEKLVPMMAGRDLTDVEMDYYRAPYLEEIDRKPVRVWPQEIPIDGIPERNQIRMAATYDRLRTSTTPLLLLVAEPGVLMDDQLVETLRAELPRMEVENIGPGMHYVQETQPTNIGKAVASWIARLDQPRAEAEIDTNTD
jgi:haloalkane dehalogenase